MHERSFRTLSGGLRFLTASLTLLGRGVRRDRRPQNGDAVFLREPSERQLTMPIEQKFKSLPDPSVRTSWFQLHR